jgi:hypothetical protein
VLCAEGISQTALYKPLRMHDNCYIEIQPEHSSQQNTARDRDLNSEWSRPFRLCVPLRNVMSGRHSRHDNGIKWSEQWGLSVHYNSMRLKAAWKNTKAFGHVTWRLVASAGTPRGPTRYASWTCVTGGEAKSHHLRRSLFLPFLEVRTHMCFTVWVA